MLFLTTECEVVTLTNEPTLSNDNNNKFYVGIILSISTIENIMIKKIEFCYDIFVSDITPCMLGAICKSTLYRFHIKVHRPTSQKGYSRKIKHVKMQLINILDRCDIRMKE